MCSVIGYIGNNFSRAFVLEGLSRLEYRGYDAAGFACLNPADNRLEYAKAGGSLVNLLEELKQKPIDGYIGMGHTRWSTHGVSSAENAHPHFDCSKKISVVHNGIIENHLELKKQLIQEKIHTFHSQTDTEIIAHLLERNLSKHATFIEAVIALVHSLEGAYAIVALLEQYPDQMLLIRKRSPLCIGIGANEMFVASDPFAFVDKTKQVLFLPESTFAIVTKDNATIYDFNGNKVSVKVQTLDMQCDIQEKKGFAHFMLKEIYEQKNAIYQTVEFLESIPDIWIQCGLDLEYVRDLETIQIIGCGSSWHSARIAQFFFESVPLLSTNIHLASEFRYMPFFEKKKAIYIAISQSGETADTLEAVSMINSLKLPTVAITNSIGSTIVRESKGFLLTQAGREVAVASTKAFSTQLVVLYWFAHKIAQAKNIIDSKKMEIALKDLFSVADLLEGIIEKYKESILRQYAPFYAKFRKMIFLGRHITYPFAMEAALKLKEIAYIFAQCYAAGELKHGPLALIDQDVPVIVFSHQDSLIYQKLLSNVQEVKARRGHIIAFAFEGQEELTQLADLSFILPSINPLLAPLAMTGLMQFFVYAIADHLGCPIDKPRNLAKSVTVE